MFPVKQNESAQKADFLYASFLNFSYLKNYNFFLPWCQLPPNMEGSAEFCEAIGASLRTQVKICNTHILCQILHFVRE